MKKVNIQNEANIKAKGDHTQKNAKAVICIDTGEVYTSALDAAEKIGVHHTTISAVCTGKIQTCKGKHYCYLSRVTESLDSIVTRLRETAAVEEDAKRWKAYQAEQEAIRKAEEKRQSDITKARDNVARLNEATEKYRAMLNNAMNELVAAEQYLESLVGNENNNKEMAA